MRFLILLFLLGSIYPIIGQELPLIPSRGSVVNLRWNDDPPYSMMDSQGNIVGIDIDILREALSRMGYKLGLIKMPFARAMASLKSGDLDIVSGVFIKPDREVFALFSDPGFSSRNVLFISSKQANKWNAQKLSDLVGSGFRLGVQIGVSYGKEYDTLLKNSAFQSQIFPVSERSQLWLMLDADRIDGLIADEFTGKYEIAQIGLQEKIVKTPIVVSEEKQEPVAIAFSKKTVNSNFVALYNKTKKQLIEDGTEQNIINYYLSNSK